MPRGQLGARKPGDAAPRFPAGWASGLTLSLQVALTSCSPWPRAELLLPQLAHGASRCFPREAGPSCEAGAVSRCGTEQLVGLGAGCAGGPEAIQASLLRGNLELLRGVCLGPGPGAESWKSWGRPGVGVLSPVPQKPPSSHSVYGNDLEGLRVGLVPEIRGSGP